MFVPLDQLYHWIYDFLPEPALLYTFSPPGQKNLSNLTMFRHWSDSDRHVMAEVICHDQEPLNFSMYENLSRDQIKMLPTLEGFSKLNPSTLNLRSALIQSSIYDQVILIHSEKNSQDLEQYLKTGYLGVHYWAHAVIAKDWYRYAKHDGRLLLDQRRYKKLFLIYNRGWTGTREYRLKFNELLHGSNLSEHSLTGFFQDPEQDLKTYEFENISWQPSTFDFVDHLPVNTMQSSASADYVPDDFNSTALSVVLETVFDDSKIHLTEKTLRPIACGHPFVLAAGPKSLEYLRSYGFKTFSPWIDESYDTESDSLTRMKKILTVLQDFANQHEHEQARVMSELDKIAAFNRAWFFSDAFDAVIQKELKTNLDWAVREAMRTRGKHFLSRPVKKIDPVKRRKKLQKLRQLRQKN